MQRAVRRTEREITTDEAMGILTAGEYGVLSMVGDDGKPYGVSMSYALRDGAIYFHCATEGRKLEHLDTNPAVSFCVVGQTKVLPGQFSTEYESAVAFGTAARVTGEEKRAGLVALIEKYSADFMEPGVTYLESKIDRVVVIRIDIEYISGKARRPR